MAYIVVDLEKLRDTANQISQYVATHKNGMQQIDSSIKGLYEIEIGSEFDILQQKWNLAYGSDSTSKKMLDMLERYALYLKSCANNYETAQLNAKNRASWI